METGNVRFKTRDVTDLLELYGVTDEQAISQMTELAERSNARDWWEPFSDVLPEWFEAYLGLEASATLIRTFDLQFVHGLLQTEAYARVVASIGARRTPAEVIDRRVQVRMTRQQILGTPASPRVWSILDEAALRRPLGGREVMRDQLRHLISVSERPAVTVQVLPYSIGAHDGASGAFTLLRFADPDLADVVYMEQLTGALYLGKPAEIEHYLDIVNRLSAVALNPEQTRRFLADVIRET